MVHPEFFFFSFKEINLYVKIKMPEKKIYKYEDQFCEKCDVKITSSNCATHLKSKQHLTNDPEQTIKPCRIELCEKM